MDIIEVISISKANEKIVSERPREVT